MTGNAFDELTWRGLIYDRIEGVEEMLARDKVTVYNGFDATGDSLHIGHMVPLLTLARLQRYGHYPILVAGGGTTLIGDPGGKTEERVLLSREEIENNLVSIKKQLAHFLDFDTKHNPARMVNNADWLCELNLVDFLRDIGKHFTINYMVAKDSVKTRFDRESGISYTEFSYMLLQSYDFLHLHDTYGCVLQTGGSDQWGNITAGVELIRKMRGHEVFGMVYPLITKADGTKFGKTESGSVWLAAERTSPFRFYQYWLNCGDADVINFLKYFTFLNKDSIDELAEKVRSCPEAREAQKALAREITLMLHGETALERALAATQALFGGDISGLSADEIEDVFSDVPSEQIPAHRFDGEGINIIDLLLEGGMLKSKGEARRSVDEGGVYVNNQRVGASNHQVRNEVLIGGQFLVLRKGKKNYHLIKVKK